MPWLRVLALWMCFAGAGFAADEQVVACNPSSPAASSGSSINLSVWFQGAPSSSVAYRWRVDTGSVITQRNGQATWNLKNATPGEQSADVDVFVNGEKAASCSVSILVTGNPPGTGNRPTSPLSDHKNKKGAPAPTRGTGAELTGRTFLIEGKTEPADFALYSYILFGAPPSASDTGRYQAVAEAVLRLLRPLEELGRTLKPSQLNATFLPVRKAPAADVNAKWLLENYDYTLGTILLQRAGVSVGSPGPFIVSVRAPLTGQKPAPPFLLQDLSHVPAQLASTWVTMFLNQAAQERFWNQNTTQNIVAHMRLALAIVAEGVPEVQKSVATWISFVK